jgi:transposase
MDIKSKNIKQQRGPNGTIYVYEDTPYWDKEKKQNRHMREYIGKIGINGEFIPNKKYSMRQQKEDAADKSVVNVPIAKKMYWGACHLLDQIGDLIGVRADMEAAFGQSSKEILSLVYYLVLEGDAPMYRFSRWAHDHSHPFGKDIPSQRVSEIMQDISESGRMAFFKRQAARRQDREYLAYDTTSVSSWSEYIKAVRYGKNKDHDSLPQVNMALVFGEESGLPVYYRVLPGNIADVSTVNKLLKDVSFLEISKLKLVMDRGFYSTDNINALFKAHHKFLISVKSNVKFIADMIQQAEKAIHNIRSYDDIHDVYSYSQTSRWAYTEKNRTGEVVLEDSRRIYIHVYYNGTRAEEEKQRFTKKLTAVKAAVTAGRDLTTSQESLCKNYLSITSTPKRGLHAEYKDEAIEEHLSRIGYFALISNDLKDSSLAIETYRRKDMVEKAFDNLKERLEMRRTSVHSDTNLEGRFFIQFLALIFVSYIHKHMRDHDLYRNYTMQSLLDSIDIIERYEYEGKRPHTSEITDKQKKLFDYFDVPL